MKSYEKFNIKLRYHIKETAVFLTEKFNITFIMLKKKGKFLNKFTDVHKQKLRKDIYIYITIKLSVKVYMKYHFVIFVLCQLYLI